MRNVLGLPYAEPPVNGSRFQKPVAKALFSTPFDRSDYGAACIQYVADANIHSSEDCLTLNAC